MQISEGRNNIRKGRKAWRHKSKANWKEKLKKGWWQRNQLK
jgi:hypothetical protein